MEGDSSGADLIGGFIMLIVLAALYFAPTVVAAARQHRQVAAIGALNLFLGWTGVGWVIALVWGLVVGENAGTGEEP